MTFAPQDALPESERDIMDQCGCMIDGLEHQDIPQRPSSRLASSILHQTITSRTKTRTKPRVGRI
ncbi:hypothetical protein M378DRAFT_162113 [Amanita muscaria Koide BX008]|uniref:Uncharacterized protein n=1 Tax=Amanita muscaria (strain Koide BX008) TaxID=946122 RepID=A0A0C2X9M6_AMAMK|nr:hypothetical protein M378DRAFT_162113 [Amanita muscaria Koide BX008]